MSELPRRDVERSDRWPDRLPPASAPLLVRGAADDWPVQALVADGRLERELGGTPVTARIRGRDEVWETTVGEYWTWCHRPDPDPSWYVKDWVITDVRDQFVPPLPSAFRSWLDGMPEERRPGWLWFFVGPPGSTSEWHVDAMVSSAWNLLVTGRKRWELASPAASADVGLLEPEVAAVLDPERYQVDLVQEPGECLVVPAGWAHRVVNEEPSSAVTGNFVNESNVEAVRAHHAVAGRDAWLRLLDKLESVSRRA